MMTRHDAVKLKCDLLINGVRLTDLRMDLNRDHGWDEARAKSFLPAELQLPHEVFCQIRENREANFRLRIIENILVVQDRNNNPVCTCELISLPPFAHEKAADSTLFEKIVVYNGSCNLNFTWNYFCDYFRTKQECRFCNLTPAQDFYPEENISNARKTAAQIGDVVTAAKRHIRDPKSIMTRGTPPQKQGLGEVAQILEMLRERFPYTSDRERTKVLMTISPTKNIADVKLLYDAGLHSVAFNFEVFDRGYWKAIVPGKDSFIGRELWEESLVEAVKHFGTGKVFSAIIAGLEPRKTLIEGVHWCCDRGIIPIVVPFSPETGSQFEGFRPPTHGWMMDTHLEAADIIASKIPMIATEEYWDNDAPICAECFTGGILYDIIRTNAGLTHYHGHNAENKSEAKKVAETVGAV
ncbi:MAG TPA: radical SAM protein [Candidatus Kapabacteria bacterium]|nr:radical SAM protein [Candidatus Kapabacteria bacterium]